MAGLSRADLAWRPAPGKWSIKEIICHLALIRQTPRSAWSRFGMHEERGRITFRDFVEWQAAHGVNHLVQIARIRRLLAARRRSRKR
jgi:hypothetical protein